VSLPAVLLAGVVREGDGTVTAWTTADQRRFTRRPVRMGDGCAQILEGVQPGDLVANEGALLLRNALAIAAR
jgi:membrane fusion protein, heavy metal efflux system